MANETPKQGMEQIPDDQMVEVTKNFFVEGVSLPVAVYLRMTSGNYLVVGRKGDKPSFSQLHAFQHPDSKAFVRNTDHPAMINFISLLTAKVVEQKSLPDQTKMKFLTSLTDDALTSLEKSGFTSFQKAQAVSKLVHQMAKNMNVFQDVMAILAGLPTDESKHAMSTCLIAMMICEEMNMTLPSALERVALGSLIHDVGMKFVPQTILEKPRHKWTPEELNVYEQHPLRGLEMLRDIKDLPMDVLLIVAEHHENAHGLGFPKKIRDVKISPMGRIVGLANYYSNLLFNQNPDGKSYSPDEALKYIEEILGQPFNKQVFSALKNIVNKEFLNKKAAASS